MDDNDALELQRRRLSDEVRESVERQLIRRYSWVGVVIATIAGVLVTLTVRDLLSDARVQLEAARQVQEDTTKRLLDATQASTKLSAETEESIKKFESTKTSVEARLKELSSEARNLRSSLAKESTATLGISANLNEELKKLTEAVKQLSEKQSSSEVEREALELKLSAISQSLGESADAIETASQVAELSVYTIRVRRRIEKSQQLAAALRELGFTVEFMEDTLPGEDISAVLVGQEIPYAIAVELLTKTREFFPAVNKLVRGTDFPKAFNIGYGISGVETREVSDSEFDKLLASQSDAQFLERLDAIKSFDW